VHRLSSGLENLKHPEWNSKKLYLLWSGLSDHNCSPRWNTNEQRRRRLGGAIWLLSSRLVDC
jgi:hypothetical protein